MPFLAYYVDTLSPFLVEFGHGLGLRYYSLAYLLGFLFLYAGLHFQARRGYLPLKAAEVDDLVVWLALAGVIGGGRLGYCLFYDFGTTWREPWTIFELWRGGMASHGGVIGVILVMLVFARKHHIRFYTLADAAALCTPVGLGLGRIANFFNGELWGRPATVPWAVIFPKAPWVGGVPVPRHPSQIYEALLEGVVLFTVLFLVRRATRREGAVALAFMAIYGIVRIVGECFREPDAPIGYYFGFITQGQLLSVGMIAAAGILALLEFKRRR
ncbi:MAG: prolipoprotein diacylglyceryl transferase [Verrucomicrobium sp.]|nr:prolipoprotein diacylglyceryl transferase [Verrucomicrobium sp.]